MVALGVGMLVGIERERTKLKAGTPAMAGLRTFSIAALVGAGAMAIGGPMLLAVFGGFVTVFMALGYWSTLKKEGPGLTTEFAMLATLLAGGLAMREPAAAGAVGVVTAILLAGRQRLQHFAGSVLTEEELRSALILAAAVVVIMPLLPNEQIGPFGALNPRSVWRLVVLVLMIGTGGYLATRLLGPRFGLPISGLASGFVSSSATIGAMGSRVAKSPSVLTAAAAGAVLSTVATVIQMAAVIGATSPEALEPMTPPLIGAGVAAAAYGAIFTLAVLRRPAPADAQGPGDPFSLAAALKFAFTLSVVLVASAALRQWFGEAGAVAAAAMAGFVDTHASAISIASLVATGHMTPQDCVIPILAGFSTNTVTKVILASTSGGRAFALRVVPGVILVALAAWAGAMFELVRR
jgi:uncharacterized membrane protein (DUF4010 family)